ncbi:uncharacterized protein LOC142223413 [Haematobia irritans]|uniref:uncharacterized protein LOC142223413 n=1 Tax=Haematobia irritans TaxID=7368 RepID=UPI003F5082A3
MILKYTLLVAVVFLALVTACQASTFKPFVRSRYSLRWRKTTENTKTLDSTTTAPKHEISPSVVPIQIVDEGMKSTQTIVRTSTHPPDYDYYGNNEIEDNDRTSNALH